MATKVSTRWTLALKIGLILGFTSLSIAAEFPTRDDQDVLTQEYAQFRREQVRDVSYEVELWFEKSEAIDKSQETFRGRTILHLELNRTDAPLSIDLLHKEISSILVDGRPVHDFVSRKGSFDLPAQHLSNQMVVQVDYVVSYNREQVGLQQFIDPQDGKEYLSSQFESYFAHLVFACLDQPDLKATYEVVIHAPSTWSAISNAPILSETLSGDQKVVKFEPTARFSTYLLFIGAGDYVKRSSTYQSKMAGSNQPLPLDIYVRQSLISHLDEEELFDSTRKGLEFFESYFDIAYPFPKYDHIFAPELGFGAMEHPGAVTMNENMIFLGPVTENARKHRESTILHEMAHMWFGDLVTMRWWDDLWLNESFATYMSQLAQNEIRPSANWQDFLGEKSWAYWTDSLVTTHPIETPVESTDVGMSNFDGITYGKGGSVLKQLSFFVGASSFQSGIRNYLKKFSWSNATRADFIFEIGLASQIDLNDWTRGWLQSSGVNSIEVDWRCVEGRLSQMTLIQTPSSTGRLLPHRTQIGLFVDPQLPPERMDVRYEGARTEIPQAIGKSCPKFVFANMGDEDYGLFFLDEKSLPEVLSSLGKISDPMIRHQLWASLFQMVRHERLSASLYLDQVAKWLPTEDDLTLFADVYGKYSFGSIYNSYLEPNKRIDLAENLTTLAWNRVQSAEPGSNEQRQLFTFYLSVARFPLDDQRMNDLLDGKGLPSGLVLGPVDRWSIITKLSHAHNPQALDRIEQESQRDPSSFGKKQAFGARVAYSELSNKENFWGQLSDPDALALPLLQAGASEFHHPDHPELSEPFVERFFAVAKTLNWKEYEYYSESFFEDLFPPLCTSSLLQRSENAMAHADHMGNLTHLVRRAWVEANDELARCIRIRSH